MKKTFLFFLSSMGVLAPLAVAATNAVPTVAFVNVTVLPMDSERTLPRHTVLVQGDRIIEAGPTASVRVPPQAQRIDGSGKFLMPGLSEMHGHNPPPGSTPEYVEQVYFLFLANGVTTVRSMLGYPGQIALREKVKSGAMLGPTLYLAGPSFSGAGANAVQTPEQAIERVRAQKAEGYDLLKVHPGLKRDVYDAMARTAKEVGLEFSGHVPTDVGLVHAIKSGQRTIDHLDGYIEDLAASSGAVDPAKLAEIVTLTRETGTWVVPTMVLWETIIGSAAPAELAAFPELKYVPRRMVDGWKTSYERKVNAPTFNRAEAKQIAANRNVLLRALADGGARIAFGTDAPQIYSVPGFSVHREFTAMKEAGMSAFAVLQSATKAVGDYYKDVDSFGTVAVGQRADLILLNENPLTDLSNMARRAGVMVRGKWISETEIQSRLEQISASTQ